MSSSSILISSSTLVLLLLLVDGFIIHNSRADDDSSYAGEPDNEQHDTVELDLQPSTEEFQRHHWNYNDQTLWSKEYPLCKGKALRQSPIDIVTSNVETRDELMVEFVDYDQDIQVKAQNTEHSVCVKPNFDTLKVKPEVRLNWLPDGGEFELEEVHFHWGDTKTKGSEHKIDGERAAAEMHMVHYKKGLEASEIGNIENSVVVVGVLIESSAQRAGISASLNKLLDFFLDCWNILFGLKAETEARTKATTKSNEELENIVEETSLVNGTDHSKLVTIDKRTENLQNLLPEKLDKFFTYNGSLTTPPCYEVVTWIVLNSPIYMSEEKLEKLSNIATSDNAGLHRISKNFRETQPLLDRPVYSSFNVLKSISSSQTSKTVK